MRHWIRRWLDWVRNDLLLLYRLRRGLHLIQIRYESMGQQFSQLPVPWIADFVFVEVTLLLSTSALRKGDFSLHFSGIDPVPAESIRSEIGSRCRIVFRFIPPRMSHVVTLRWKKYLIASLNVPILSESDYLTSLTVSAPTIGVRLAGQTLPVREFVPEECEGLQTWAVLRSPYRLAYLSHLELTVEFQNLRSRRSVIVPVALSAEQQAALETIAVVHCPIVPRRSGKWRVAWRIAGREIVASVVEAIAARVFEDSIQLLDLRYSATDLFGSTRLLGQLPPLTSVARVEPCFVVVSTRPGAAGICRFAILVTHSTAHALPKIHWQTVIISDAPTRVATGIFVVSESNSAVGCELRLKDRVLGTASLSPMPTASFTAEGGYKTPPEFNWSEAAEEELHERLNRLAGNN